MASDGDKKKFFKMPGVPFKALDNIKAKLKSVFRKKDKNADKAGEGSSSGAAAGGAAATGAGAAAIPGITGPAGVPHDAVAQPGDGVGPVVTEPLQPAVAPASAAVPGTTAAPVASSAPTAETNTGTTAAPAAGAPNTTST